MPKSRFPNGLSTKDMDVSGALAVTGNATIGGTVAVTGVITPTAVVAGAASKAISVDCTNDYALTSAQKNATTIVISAAGSGKVLTLGMAAGQLVAITNGGANNVTVKNLAADTGVAITAAKTAVYLVTAAEPIKIVETA